MKRLAGICACVAAVSLGPSLGAKTVKVSDFGFDAADSTAFLRAAIESDADEVVVDRASGPWVCGPLSFRGLAARTIRFERGVEVRAKPGEFRSTRSNDACLLSFWDCDGITLSGYGAAIRMERDAYAKPPYAHSEHRHCLNLRGVRDFRVEGLTLAESGGDGVFVGGSWKDGRFRNSENVTLVDVVCDRNYRQGLSIICVSNFVARGCVFSNTRGTPPESGVDVEPNYPHEPLSGIVFRDCRFENNAGRGLEFYVGSLNSKTPPVTALLERCTMTGNVNGFEYQQSRAKHDDLPKGGEVVLRDCTIEGSRGSGILLIDKPGDSARIVLDGVRLVDCCAANTNAPDVSTSIRLADTPPTDGVEFRRVSISRPVARPWITPGRTDYTGRGARDFSGALTLVTAGRSERIALDAGFRAAIAPQPADGPTRPRAGAFDRRGARVVDPAPGEMRSTGGVVASGRHRIVFYAEKAREVRIRVQHVRLHRKRPLTLRRMLVTGYGGDKCTYLAMPDSEEPAELTFRPKRAGFYAIDVDAGRQGLRFLAANVPIASEIVTQAVRFGLGSSLHFRARGDFSLFVSADSYERAACSLFRPDGREAWSLPLLTDSRRFQGDGGDGLWRLDLRRPRGMHRTVGVDLTGVNAFMFFSDERHW